MVMCKTFSWLNVYFQLGPSVGVCQPVTGYNFTCIWIRVRHFYSCGLWNAMHIESQSSPIIGYHIHNQHAVENRLLKRSQHNFVVRSCLPMEAQDLQQYVIRSIVCLRVEIWWEGRDIVYWYIFLHSLKVCFNRGNHGQGRGGDILFVAARWTSGHHVE